MARSKYITRLENHPNDLATAVALISYTKRLKRHDVQKLVSGAGTRNLLLRSFLYMMDTTGNTPAYSLGLTADKHKKGCEYLCTRVRSYTSLATYETNRGSILLVAFISRLQPHTSYCNSTAATSYCNFCVTNLKISLSSFYHNAPKEV